MFHFSMLTSDSWIFIRLHRSGRSKRSVTLSLPKLKRIFFAKREEVVDDSDSSTPVRGTRTFRLTACGAMLLLLEGAKPADKGSRLEIVATANNDRIKVADDIFKKIMTTFEI